MYSNKDNVNILTALLMAHGVKHAVCCPGSRNSAIVHNLNECPDIQCYPVTDERSAGFYALGMTIALDEPVVVCVTSGTALLNLAPAVAEAYYQQRPLVVVSADRPPQWIDQLDGQTLPQPDALGRFVRKAVSLPEPYDEETRWYCNRLVNEALMMRGGPVHINVPITEPLFQYTTAVLPQERKIELTPATMSPETLDDICCRFMQAERPMLIAGQPWNPLLEEAVLQVQDDASYVNVVQGDPQMVAEKVRSCLEQTPHPFVQRWTSLVDKVRQQTDAFEPSYSQSAAVQYFEQRRGNHIVHYANSMAIRLANRYARSSVYCNRGVNGIEGSLSTAAGFSCVTDSPVFCVIGDLSFFYDQNALWNQNLRGNLRILLLNNGRGGIFNMLPGLEQSPARDQYVAAEHHATAEGICRQNDVVYLKATNMQAMQQGIDTLLYIESSRPVLLEVLFT